MTTSNSTTGQDTYDQALRRRMHSALPPVLMEIADKRPADPILFLAQRLHELRANEDQQEESTLKLNPSTTVSTRKFTIKESSHTDHTDKLNRALTDSDPLEIYHSSNFKLHSDSLVLLTRIGDLFDEEDIS